MTLLYQTPKMRQACLEMLKEAGPLGLTALDIEEALDKRGGSVSGALSTLHKSDQVARLPEKRRGHRVYVLPQYAEDRATERQGRNRSCPHCGEPLDF